MIPDEMKEIKIKKNMLPPSWLKWTNFHPNDGGSMLL
jgi:hypothetical protein